MAVGKAALMASLSVATMAGQMADLSAELSVEHLVGLSAWQMVAWKVVAKAASSDDRMAEQLAVVKDEPMAGPKVVHWAEMWELQWVVATADDLVVRWGHLTAGLKAETMAESWAAPSAFPSVELTAEMTGPMSVESWAVVTADWWAAWKEPH